MDDLRALLARATKLPRPLRRADIAVAGDSRGDSEILIVAAVNALPGLLDRLAAVERDAERYRHIRPMFRAFSVHIDGNHSWVATGELGRMRGPSLDAAIDAALAVIPASTPERNKPCL